MPKERGVRTLMESQQVKWSETLLKSSRQQFCHIFLSIWKNFSSKNSVLVVPEILRLFLNILTPDVKYSLSGKVSVERNQFKWYFLKNPKFFFKIFLHYWHLPHILNTLKKMMSLIGDLFPKLLTAKGVAN